jgi:hypothetical protein
MPKFLQLDRPEWEALRRATGDLYEAFASYPLRTTIPYCTHCLSEAFDAELRAQPLHALRADTAFTILANPGTWGEEVDVKHFLPRLFELVTLAVVDPRSALYYEVESLGHRVATEGKGFTGWPERERAAVTAYCLAWLRAALATWPSSPFALDETVETVLCAIAQFTDDFARYLAVFGEAMGSTASLAPVAHFLVLTCKYVLTPYDPSWVRNAWWESCQEYWQQLLAWIEDPATARIAQNTLELAQASGVSSDARSFEAHTKDSKDASDVAEALEWIATWAQESTP